MSRPETVWTIDMLPGRLAAKLVESDNGCWHWTGARNKRNGYGCVARTGKSATTPHKLVYETLVGPVPAGMHVGHVCHDLDPTCPGGPGCEHRICANPAHLATQTPDENNNAAYRQHVAHHRGLDHVPPPVELPFAKLTAAERAADWADLIERIKRECPVTA